MDTQATIHKARALFPRGLQQPQGSLRFGADALLLAAFAARQAEGLSPARRTGLAPSRIRFYESIGLLQAVQRQANDGDQGRDDQHRLF